VESADNPELPDVAYAEQLTTALHLDKPSEVDAHLEVFEEVRRHDLVLVRFSCHGISDGQHRLYFATTNIKHTRPAGLAVCADWPFGTRH
jgi:hypothetical protein